ncbi:MAG: hypothetical protein ACKVP3_05005 [Hyphomicrobiaceae bacterium]
MTPRKMLLRANALYLLAAAAGGLSTDLAGAFLGSGPFAKVLAAAHDTAIGFVEAHGLALIIGCLLWQAEPVRKWHLAAAAVHALLGICNLTFWQLFIAADMLAMGYVTTSLHGLFLALQLTASAVAKASAGWPSRGQTQINALSTRNQSPVKAG